MQKEQLQSIHVIRAHDNVFAFGVYMVLAFVAFYLLIYESTLSRPALSFRRISS